MCGLRCVVVVVLGVLSFAMIVVSKPLPSPSGRSSVGFSIYPAPSNSPSNHETQWSKSLADKVVVSYDVKHPPNPNPIMPMSVRRGQTSQESPRAVSDWTQRAPHEHQWQQPQHGPPMQQQHHHQEEDMDPRHEHGHGQGHEHEHDPDVNGSSHRRWSQQKQAHAFDQPRPRPRPQPQPLHQDQPAFQPQPAPHSASSSDIEQALDDSAPLIYY